MVPTVDDCFDRHGRCSAVVATTAWVVGALCHGGYSGRCVVVVRFPSVVSAKRAPKVKIFDKNGWVPCMLWMLCTVAGCARNLLRNGKKRGK